MNTKRVLALSVVATAVAAAFLLRPDPDPGPVNSTTAAQTTARGKPLCVYPVNPSVAPPIDCEPPGLPPDPGPAGMATIDGLCAAAAGALEPCDPEKHPERIRADVERYIAEWAYSPLAVASLTLAAQGYLRGAHYGASINKEETIPKIVRESACISALETQQMHDGGARMRLKELALNTEDRRRASQSYNRVFHGTLFPLFEGTPDQACGFDVAALVRAEGTRTLHDRYREDSIEFSKFEEQGAPK